jgi:CBS domain-containing protein
MSAWLAEDIMNPDVLTVRDDMLVRDLALFLTEHEISGAPVVDAGGRPVGVVSETDVVSVDRAGRKDDSGPSPYYLRAFENRFSVESIRGLRVEEEALTVSDIMTPVVISVARDMPVSRIARLMLNDHIHRVIVREGESIAGIVTSFDMLRLFVDDESAEVLRKTGEGPRSEGAERLLRHHHPEHDVDEQTREGRRQNRDHHIQHANEGGIPTRGLRDAAADSGDHLVGSGSLQGHFRLPKDHTENGRRGSPGQPCECDRSRRAGGREDPLEAPTRGRRRWKVSRGSRQERTPGNRVRSASGRGQGSSGLRRRPKGRGQLPRALEDRLEPRKPAIGITAGTHRTGNHESSSHLFLLFRNRKKRNCRDRANIGEDRSGRKIPRPQNREDQVVGNPLRGFTGPRLERERRPVCPEIGPAGAAQPEMPPKPSSFRFRELPRKKTVDEVDHFAAGQQHLQRRAPRGESIGSWMPQARPRFRVISRPSGNARQGLRAGPAGPGAAGF